MKFIYLWLFIYSFCPILVNKDCQLQAVITQALSCESTPPYLSCCMSHPNAHKNLVSVPGYVLVTTSAAKLGGPGTRGTHSWLHDTDSNKNFGPDLRCKNVLMVLYHHAKFGGVRILPAAGAAINVCLFVTLLNN